MSGEVAHNVPVKNLHGDVIGLATVAKSHIEIVFSRADVGETILTNLLYCYSDGIIIQSSHIPAVERSKNTS